MMAARTEMAADANVGVSVSSAPVMAPSFDEVDYQTNLTVVFEIIDSE
jgi:hypothetical protein